MADDQTPAQPGATTENPSDTPTAADTPTEDRGDAPREASPDRGDVGGEGTTAPRKKAAARKRPAKKAAPAEQSAPSDDAAPGDAAGQEAGTGDQPPADKPAVKKTTRKRTTKKAAAAPAEPSDTPGGAAPSADADAADSSAQTDDRPTPPTVLFQPPPATPAPARRARSTKTDDEAGDGDPAGDPPGSDSGATGEKSQGGARQGARSGKSKAQGKQGKAETAPDGAGGAGDDQAATPTDGESADQDDESQDGQDESGSEDGAPRRRRRRGGRRRRGKGGQDGDGNAQDDDTDGSDSGSDGTDSDSDDSDDSDDSSDDSDQSSSSSSRRRRRRRRSGDGGDDSSDDSDGGGTKVRSARAAEDEITSFTGSTRLEAKKQRRREGREAGRRRAPVISEAEFLARRESVNRKMVVRQRDDLTQIAVMEDKVLVEHYVARESQTSLIGNVYLGRVQNVLPSMEAAFIDIGRGRNAVLYAGEVNWDALGAGGNGGKERKIEQVLKPGQSVLVQVSKDPIGHKGARLTSQISLPGRFLVYVPEGNTSGISRKLPDTERNRLKSLLKEIVPSEAGVIVRTAAEGAAEDELRRDVARLTARWEDIKGKVEGGNAPQELYSEPDLTLKVVRDLFTEDIGELVVSGADAWDMVSTYVDQVAPDLADRLTQHDDSENDAFAAYRIDEQIAKALERKVWLPSGGSLIIDRTEAMTVVDVNTGKFTGSGGNLEETVTKNNLEAAEEIVRQLRLRDIGGIIVIDFIDMVLESNRDLVLRRLIECLGRDRTRHQVAEVTSLGLVQMTRKRIGTGLLEAFSEQCEHCQGRGYHVHPEPVEQKKRAQEDDSKRARRGRRGKSDEQDGGNGGNERNDRNGRKGRDDRKGGAANGGGNGTGSGDGGDHGDNGVRRPTPAEFAAMAHRQAEAEAAEDRGAATKSAGQDGEAASTGDGPKQAVQTVQAGQAEEPGQSGQSGQSGQQVADARPEADQVSEEQSVPEQPGEPAQPEQPSVPEGPRIVTSTRRRGARRAAGPPRAEVSEKLHLKSVGHSAEGPAPF